MRRRAASPARCRSRPACSRLRCTRRTRCTFPLENIVDGYGVAPDRSAHPRFRQSHGPHQRRHHLRRPHPVVCARHGQRRQEACGSSCRRTRARSTASHSPKFSLPSAATSTRSTLRFSAPPWSPSRISIRARPSTPASCARDRRGQLPLTGDASFSSAEEGREVP